MYSDLANFQSKSDAIVDDLLYRLHRDMAVVDGANNMLRTMKGGDKKAIKDLNETIYQVEEKIDLIRLSLKKYLDGLPSESPKRVLISREMDNRRDKKFSPTTSLPPAPNGDTPKSSRVNERRSVAPAPTLAVSGKLDFNLLGCLNVLSEIPGRSLHGEYGSIAGGSSYSDFGKYKSAKAMQRQYRLVKFNCSSYVFFDVDSS